MLPGIEDTGVRAKSDKDNANPLVFLSGQDQGMIKRPGARESARHNSLLPPNARNRVFTPS